jgi:alkanesulfonate monooxygenase SsuD/methylene tetrahydromethanopterin reductase-like flavin-dependent oxidoreductase (luciferase family)
MIQSAYFQRFATLYASSGGRAEVILGRGSFTGSFPLFGYELSQGERLFEEKLDLFAALVKREPIVTPPTMPELLRRVRRYNC